MFPSLVSKDVRPQIEGKLKYIEFRTRKPKINLPMKTRFFLIENKHAFLGYQLIEVYLKRCSQSIFLCF